MRRWNLVLVSCVALVACGDDAGSGSDTPDPEADVSVPVDTLDETTPEVSPDTVDEVGPEVVADTAADTDDVTPEAETTTPVDPEAVFAFRAEPGQSFSDGPFPSDALINPGGYVALAPLADDPRMASLANADTLALLSDRLRQRRGFGFVSSVFFPMNAAPDLASFEGAVHYVALSGPEAGAVLPGVAAWYAHADLLSVFPAWGHYLVPGATYAVIIDPGVTTADGTPIAAPAGFAALMAADAGPSELAHARAAFAPLREWLAVRDQAAVIGTVFTTEDTMTYIDRLFAGVDAFALEPPTANVRYDAEAGWVTAPALTGAALDAYFGAPAEPFLHTPTPWYAGTREDAARLSAGAAPYAGGSFRGQVAWVQHGTFLAPAFNQTGYQDGQLQNSTIAWSGSAPVVRTRALVPFTVFLCASHLKDGAPDPDRAVPFALFTHGGTALRSDALPYAVANCAAGFATVSFDLPYHGGRQDMVYLPEQDLVAPARADAENVFSGTVAGEDGFVPDHIGDNGGSTTTVGGLFALGSRFDPLVIEANLSTIATDAYTLVRYLKEPGAAGLGAFIGTRVDASRLVAQSLSFGTSFTTALMAASDDFVGAVQSVGSVGILSLNLPMAPNNASLAGGILRTILGLASTLPEINAGAHHDPVIALLQWLSQLGDPAAYAPFVLRHRRDDHVLHVLGSGNSWDETLFSPAQLTFDRAWGVPAFTAGPAWTLDPTIPGAETVVATPLTAPVANNATFGARTQSAAFFYNAAACHAQAITPLCESGFAPPYPPATPRAEPVVTVSPMCALHTPLIAFLDDLAAGEPPAIVTPAGSCTELYAP